MTKISPSIFKPLVSQVSRRNMPLSAAVNSLDDMVSPCHTTSLMLVLLLSLCRWTVIELFLRSQVVYSKQPKLGLTQEFVVLLVRMPLVVCMFVCLFVITCLFVLQAI